MRARKLLTLAVCAAVAVMVAGCINAETKWTICPDGAGRMDTVTNVDMKMIKQLQQMAPPGAAGEMPSIPGMGKGLIGPSKMKMMVAEAFFRDINQVEGGGAKFTFKKLDDGTFELVAKVDLTKAGLKMPGGLGGAMGGGKTEPGEDEIGGDEGDGTDEQPKDEGDPQQKMMQAMMMANTTIKVVIVMPGTVLETQGGTSDGRTATFIIQGKDMQDLKGEAAIKTFTVKCAAPDAVAQAEFAKIAEQINQAEVEENASDEGDEIK